MSNSNSSALKAIKSLRLAVSAEKIGSSDESDAAAATAGRLWAGTGKPCDELYVAVGGAAVIHQRIGEYETLGTAWSLCVDAYYTAMRTLDESLAPVADLDAAYEECGMVRLSDPERGATMTALWAEVRRSRG